MTDTESGHFRLSRDGAIATITLARGEKRNALTAASLRQLQRLAEDFREDDQTRVVIIRADGPDFSAGADLGTVGGGRKPPRTEVMRRGATQGALLVRALREIHQPTIAVLHGVATGGATCIATACDFRIAAGNARIGYGEVKLGINLMWNAIGPCVELVGPARAKTLIMSGALHDAATLERWGFLDRVVPLGEQDAAALAMAQQYAALPPVAVQMIKRSVNAVAGALNAAVLHADADQWLLAARTSDFREAMTAFREKRPGVFTGD